jgi:hypothetical protein
MLPARQGYNISVNLYTRSGYVDVVKACNGFTVTNVGDDIVNVNGMILYPGVIGTSLGDSRSIGGNEGEVYQGNIQVMFAGAGANPSLEVIQKFYSDPQTIGSDTGILTQ